MVRFFVAMYTVQPFFVKTWFLFGNLTLYGNSFVATSGAIEGGTHCWLSFHGIVPF